MNMEMMNDSYEKKERKKKLHELLDKYDGDVQALEDDPGVDGIDYMFAKRYLNEVLDERKKERERSAVQVKRGRNELEEYDDSGVDRFREDVKRKLQESVEKVVKKEKVETPADMYFEDRHWELLGQKESKGVYDKINTEGGGMGALGKYQMRKGILMDLGYVNGKGEWLGKDGIYSTQDFLSLPKVQEKAARQMMNIFYKQIKPCLNMVGEEIAGIKAHFDITERGLMAAAHREGHAIVKDYLKLLEKNKEGMYYFPYSKVSGKVKEKYAAVETRLREFAE